MNFYLLDVVAGSEFVVVAGLGVLVFMAGCVLTEAAVIYWLKAAPSFKKAFWVSALVNVITMLVGFAVVPKIEDALGDESQGPLRFAIYFAASVVIEGLLLKPLLKNIGWGKLALAALLMNVVTYGLLLAFIGIDF